MNRPARFLAGFALTSVLLTGLSVAVARDWRPATPRPPLNPVAAEPFPPASPLASSQTAVRVPPAPGRPGGPGAAAWILRPTTSKAGGRPAAVLIHGAGAGTRDTLLAEARALAAAGVAAIVYDKGSAYNPVHRDFGVLADDALRAAEVLRDTSGIDPARVGLMGWSEGGWVVAEAARRAPGRVAFAAFASAPVVSPASQLTWMATRAVPATPGWLEKTTATMLGAGRGLLPWTAYDSRPGLAALTVPVLAIWGADDPIVPVNEAVATVRDGVTGPTSLHILPAAGHELPVASRYLERVAIWLSAGTPADRAVRGVEPAVDLGVGTLPEPSWISHPLLHLAVSILVAALAASARRRPRSDRRAATPTLVGAH